MYHVCIYVFFSRLIDASTCDCLRPLPWQLKEAADYQKDVLQPEDIGLCESVQRGLYSKGYNQGRFIVDKGKTELSEHAVHHFQTMVMEALGFELD